MSPADPNTDARADATADVGALMAQGESKERGSNNEVQVPVVGMTDALDPEALAKLLGPPVARESDAPAPFLDVFNICTLKERNGKGYDVSDFSKLLVEPVAVPSLHHTGVHTSMAELAPDAANDLQTRGSGAQGPFFYANDP
ncbi:Hypothetical Protein FCC1311_008042 [Hondaea fermentalgiana]|uniref:Uncharacterized protein n=1 Tax=Hondaea fermentalgiana TaxID=2315210 RepID=A0A2R5G220_9STRA|nr:Hypothetical Protein FCC1311_008042 [Hondaea fermentalgiana]|eukprot:GBG24585.1 Hypothetical Protein FCC1311_008042 [Hondaea fermentalgiana]